MSRYTSGLAPMDCHVATLLAVTKPSALRVLIRGYCNSHPLIANEVKQSTWQATRCYRHAPALEPWTATAFSLAETRMSRHASGLAVDCRVAALLAVTKPSALPVLIQDHCNSHPVIANAVKQSTWQAARYYSHAPALEPWTATAFGLAVTTPCRFVYRNNTINQHLLKDLSC